MCEVHIHTCRLRTQHTCKRGSDAHIDAARSSYFSAHKQSDKFPLVSRIYSFLAWCVDSLFLRCRSLVRLIHTHSAADGPAVDRANVIHLSACMHVYIRGAQRRIATIRIQREEERQKITETGEQQQQQQRHAHTNEREKERERENEEEWKEEIREEHARNGL